MKLRAILISGVCSVGLSACAMDAPSQPNDVKIYSYKLSEKQLKEKLVKQAKAQHNKEAQSKTDTAAQLAAAKPKAAAANLSDDSTLDKNLQQASDFTSNTDDVNDSDYNADDTLQDTDDNAGDATTNNTTSMSDHLLAPLVTNDGSNNYDLADSSRQNSYDSDNNGVNVESNRYDDSASSSNQHYGSGAVDQASARNLNLLEREAQRLFVQLKCLSCEDESLATSDSPFATNIREWVFSQLKAGRSIDSIRQSLVDRYGNRILLHRDFAFRRGLLWLAPILIFFILALSLIYSIFTRRRKGK